MRHESLMTQYQDWQRIAARIRGLCRATTALWEGMEFHRSGDYYQVTNQWLIPSAKTLIAELEKFRTSHQAHLSEEALDSLR